MFRLTHDLCELYHKLIFKHDVPVIGEVGKDRKGGFMNYYLIPLIDYLTSITQCCELLFMMYQCHALSFSCGDFARPEEASSPR